MEFAGRLQTKDDGTQKTRVQSMLMLEVTENAFTCQKVIISEQNDTYLFGLGQSQYAIAVENSSRTGRCSIAITPMNVPIAPVGDNAPAVQATGNGGIQ
jgi:hypothetical protein